MFFQTVGLFFSELAVRADSLCLVDTVVVSSKITPICEVFTTVSAVVWFHALVDALDVLIKISLPSE